MNRRAHRVSMQKLWEARIRTQGDTTTLGSNSPTIRMEPFSSKSRIPCITHCVHRFRAVKERPCQTKGTGSRARGSCNDVEYRGCSCPGRHRQLKRCHTRLTLIPQPPPKRDEKPTLRLTTGWRLFVFYTIKR